MRELFFEGDWDRARAEIEGSRTETIWSASREITDATMRVARHGPSPELFETLETARRRLIAAGDRQWLLVAATSAACYARAGRCEEALERGDSS